MAASIKFDVTRKARVVNNSRGITIYRQCVVYNIPITAGDSDPSVLLKCLALTSSPRFPQIDDAHPDVTNSNGALVIQQEINSFDTHTNTVDATIIYFAPRVLEDAGGGIFFTVTTQSTQSSVRTGMTYQGILPIELWYSPGDSGVQAPPAGATVFCTEVQKIKCSEVLRASAYATKAQWDDVKADIRAGRGKINAPEWGGYPQGYWLFLGPSTRTLDSSGNSLFIQLDFAGDEDLWYRLAVYRDEFGRIPEDVDPESVLRDNGPPAEGALVQANGVTWASVQGEMDFNPLFGFTPD